MSDGEQEVKKARVETVDSPEAVNVVETTKEEPVFALVKDSEDGELMELPCNPDKSLSLVTLSHAFPGATGLKFKNPKTGASRALLLDPTCSFFVCPHGGWEDKIMFAIFPPKVSEEPVVQHQSGSKGDAKRRKVASEHDSDDEASEKREKLEETQDLIVLGLPYSATDEIVRAYFQQFGDVKMVDLKIDFNGKSKGFGFVQMETMEGQDKVLDALEHHISGRRCDVKLPDPDYGSKESKVGKVVSNKIFIARMTDKITVEDLHNYFTEECARVSKMAKINCEVNDVYIPKPFRGFGFVTLSHTSVAKKLCEKGSANISGVSVALSVAQPRNDEAFAYNSPNRYDYGTAYGYGYGSEYNRGYRPSGDAWGYDPSAYGYGGYDQAYYTRSQKRPFRGASGAYPPTRGAYTRGGFQQGSHNLANGIDNLNLNRQQGGGEAWYPLQQTGLPGAAPPRS